MKIKMVDIARHLGVSKATVSLAVNGKPGVNEETRRMVLECLEEMKKNNGVIPVKENIVTVSGHPVNQMIKIVIVNHSKGAACNSETDLWSDVLATFDSEARRKYGYPSSANMDMWVTGYTPEYAVSLWYGYTKAEKGYYLGNDGYSARGKLFRQVISSISDRSGTKKFTVPSSVVKVTVEKETSPLMLPSANTPNNMKVTEYFKKGTQPTEVSPRYSTLPNASGLNAKTNGNQIELSWTAANKPEYLTDDYFRKNYKTFFGSSLEEQLAARKASQGEFGYEVFVKDNSTGVTNSLGFTTNTTFKATKQNKNVTYKSVL